MSPPEVDIKLLWKKEAKTFARKLLKDLCKDSSPRMEPLLVENHEQGVEEAGGDHHQRHCPAEHCKVSMVRFKFQLLL